MKTISSAKVDYNIKIPKRWVQMNNHPLLEEINQMFGMDFGEQEKKILYVDKKNQMNALFIDEMKMPQEYVNLTTGALIYELGMSDVVREGSINNKTFFWVAEQLDLDYIVMGAFTKNKDVFYSFIIIFNNTDLPNNSNISQLVGKMFESIKFKNPENQSEEKSRLAVAELREKERIEIEAKRLAYEEQQKKERLELEARKAEEQRQKAELRVMQDKILSSIDTKLDELNKKVYNLSQQIEVFGYKEYFPGYNESERTIVEERAELRQMIHDFNRDRNAITAGRMEIIDYYRDLTELPDKPFSNN
jgi:hypothetical protein